MGLCSESTQHGTWIRFACHECHFGHSHSPATAPCTASPEASTRLEIKIYFISYMKCKERGECQNTIPKLLPPKPVSSFLKKVARAY